MKNNKIFVFVIKKKIRFKTIRVIHVIKVANAIRFVIINVCRKKPLRVTFSSDETDIN